MPVFKDEKTNKWYAMVRFTDWQGQRRQKWALHGKLRDEQQATGKAR